MHQVGDQPRLGLRMLKDTDISGHTMQAYEGLEVQLQAFLTLALDWPRRAFSFMPRPLYSGKWHNRRQHGPHSRSWRFGEKFLDSSGSLKMIPRSFNPLRSNGTDRATPAPVACNLSVILYLCKCGWCHFPSPQATGNVTWRDVKLKCQLLELIMIQGTQRYSPPANGS